MGTVNRKPRIRPLWINGIGLLLAIDVIETAIYTVTLNGKPRRKLAQKRVRQVIEEQLRCPIETFTWPWKRPICLPLTFDFLRKNTDAIEMSQADFDGRDFIEHQLGFENYREHDIRATRAAFRRLFSLIASDELTEDSFR